MPEGVAGGDPAVGLKGGLQLSQLLQGGVPADVLIGSNDGVLPLAMDGDGDDLLLEFACVNGGGGTLLGAEGILIHVLPGNPVGIGHVFGSDAHRGAHAQVGQGVPHGIPQLHVAVLLAVAGVKHHKGSGAHAVGTAGP